MPLHSQSVSTPLVPTEWKNGGYDLSASFPDVCPTRHPPETALSRVITDMPESEGLSKSVVDAQGFVKSIVENGEGDGKGL